MHIVSRFCSKAGTEYPVYPKLNGSRPLLHWEALPNLNDSIINTLLKKKAKGNQKGPQCTIFPCTAIFPDIFCNLLLQQRFEMLHNTPCYLSDLDVPRIIRLFLAPLSWRSPQRIRSISCNYLSVDLKKKKNLWHQLCIFLIYSIQPHKKTSTSNFSWGCGVNCAAYNETFILCERLAIRMQVVT